MKHIKGTGYVETTGEKVCSKRVMDLRLAIAYGRGGDIESFTRLCIESSVRREMLVAAFRSGKGGAQ
jgi:hypothetical protein